MKRFERSNGLDTALYKNYLYLFRGGRERKREPEASEASGIVGHHLGVTSLNVELRNYVISRQIVIERRVT